MNKQVVEFLEKREEIATTFIINDLLHELCRVYKCPIGRFEPNVVSDFASVDRTEAEILANTSIRSVVSPETDFGNLHVNLKEQDVRNVLNKEKRGRRIFDFTVPYDPQKVHADGRDTLAHSGFTVRNGQIRLDIWNGVESLIVDVPQKEVDRLREENELGLVIAMENAARKYRQRVASQAGDGNGPNGGEGR
jgi:hypothetical protein